MRGVPRRSAAHRRVLAAGAALVVAAVLASFVWQMILGFCPVP